MKFEEHLATVEKVDKSKFIHAFKGKDGGDYLQIYDLVVS
jgi:hypothetical protein